MAKTKQKKKMTSDSLIGTFWHVLIVIGVITIIWVSIFSLYLVRLGS